MSLVHITTISGVIASITVGTGLFIIAMLGKDCVGVAALVMAGGLVIAFVREFWIKRW